MPSLTGALSLLMLTALQSPENRLAGWGRVSPPQPGSVDQACGVWTPWHAVPVEADGKLEIRRSRDVHAKPDVRPPFPVTAGTKTSRPNVNAIQVADGWLVAVDEGEFGATLRWYDPSGTKNTLLSNRHVVAFVPGWTRPEREGVLVLEGFAHMSVSEGAVALVTRTDQGEWTREVVTRLPARPGAFVRERTGAITIVHDAGVTRILPDRKVQQLAKVDLFGLRPSSLLVRDDGDRLLGMRRFVVHVEQDGAVTWYVPNGCERFTAIEPGQPGGPDCTCDGK